MQQHRRDRLLLLALVAFNLVLKLLWLGRNELAHDEPFTVYWSQQPLSTFSEMLRTENNPPLYFLLIKAWSAIVPFEAAWLRVPSAVFSALTVWPLFLLAQRLGGVRTALLASLLFTLNNYHYGFAHEVRAYSLFALLAATGMWLLWRAQDKPNNGLRAMLGLSALNTLMVYTHFFGWLAIGVQLLCVMVLPELRSLRRNFLIGIGITLLWFSPYLIIFISRLGTSVAHGTWLEAPVPEELYNMIWRWSNAPVLAIGFLALILFAAVRTRLGGSAMRLAMIWCLVPLLGMFAVSFAVPMFLDRYLVYAAPGFALLVALCVRQLRVPDKAVSLIAACAVVGMAFTFTPWKEGRHHPRRVYDQVQAYCTHGCSIMVLPEWYGVNYTAAMSIVHLRNGFTAASIGRTWYCETDGGIGLERTSLADTVVVVNAGLPADQRDWFRELTAERPEVDSVEADHRVWVFRFHR